MHLHTYLALLATVSTPAAAFYHYEQLKPIKSMGAFISKGFSYRGPNIPEKEEDGLFKLKIQKKSYTKRHGSLATRAAKEAARFQAKSIEKRVNGFSVVSSPNPSQANSAAIDQDGTDFSYFAVATLGSSAESVYMLLDTGSSSTWVMGQGCTSAACTGHDLFGSSDSTTLQTTSQTFSIGYTTGAVSGNIVSDSLSFAGMTLNMQFGLANTVSNDFNNYPMDGIIGLARVGSSTSMTTPTFMQNVVKSGDLKNNLFGINLFRDSSGVNNGEINFGAPDSSKYSGSLNYLNTVGMQSRWIIPADDIAVNGQNLGLTGRDAIFDTGTSYMLIPPADAKALFAQVPGSQSSNGEVWAIPCSTQTVIALVFNGIGYSISPKDYVGPSAGSGNLCQSHIIGLAVVDDSTWLLGDTFLKNVYSVYDVDNNRIGLGSKGGVVAGSSSSSSSSSSSAAPATSAASSSAGSSSSQAAPAVQPVTSTTGSGSSSSAGGNTSPANGSSSPSTSNAGASSNSNSTSNSPSPSASAAPASASTGPVEGILPFGSDSSSPSSVSSASSIATMASSAGSASTMASSNSNSGSAPTTVSALPSSTDIQSQSPSLTMAASPSKSSSAAAGQYRREVVGGALGMVAAVLVL